MNPARRRTIMKPYRYPKPCFVDNAVIVETDEYRFYISITEWMNQGGE